ncbi:aminopeptidase P family protein [Acidocella aminolytica]|jgi:Xaa-Pro aminopeptidase|uniref:Xaa-Pro aminopeptidase n=3 Tax=Acidocella TaxID=50709 RepID=A0A0D6PFR2_9PROT|nr:aminopeptidase P family protein [Acidocella aminolytica]GAN80517.1 Xaa-Pro aminopeptidase [Acidocella aminolytica 101 = DSM 11237]SHF39738.1 Xaa-Pro aminopeptidase [Acidocella aminolytica 101 = DSM 11237]
MSSEHSKRLAALRAQFQAHGLNGYIIPRSDEYLGEYVPACAERLAWVSGFTGSAGFAIALAERASIFSDGRYTLQLEQQTDATLWERHHIIEDKPEDWLRDTAPGRKIGFDPWTISADVLARFTGVDMVPVAPNLIDAIWADRPAPPLDPALPYPETHSGEPAAAKRRRLGAALAKDGQDAAILSDGASLAWLFNIRGTDLEFCPFALGYALLRQDGSAMLFMAPEKINEALRAHLGDEVRITGHEALPGAIAALTGQTVRYDPATMPVWFKTALEQAGAVIANGADPVALPRACKNTTEQNGARTAHLRDGVAMVEFLAWAAEAMPQGGETEISAAEHLLACRARQDLFRGESFPAISGAGENGAIIHYRVTPESNRPILPNEVYLIDSGGQYLDGTTDITRTLWTGPGPAPAQIKEHVTRVLAGTIALARAIFPEGVAGAHLDVLARQELWRAGLDYDHGTGHGVGAYLSVHEGPVGISRAARPVPLAEGMILSDEPGYYLPGAYGIRMENLLLVKQAAYAGAKKPFLRFETLTLVPFDRALIDPTLLPGTSLDWLNSYHARLRTALSPQLSDKARLWLLDATAPIL